MAYVYVLNGRERYSVHPLQKDVTTFGQRDDADIVLKDPWISWTHARIVREGAGWAIEDLGSTNGTYVDCVRVRRRVLKDDDVIFLGRTHLLFVTSSRLPSAPPPGAKPREPAAERAGLATDRLRVRPPTKITGPPAEETAESLGLSKSSEFEFRGPLEDYGRIEELEDVAREPDTDGFLAPPPVEPESGAELAIDVGDLLDSNGKVISRPPSGEAGPGDSSEAGELRAAPASSDELDPIAARDAEIERLRAALATRDAEIRQLREEVRKLKEQYLDL
jgi:hypothetical protein